MALLISSRREVGSVKVIARLLRLHNEGKQDACVQQVDAGETKEAEA